MSASQISVCQIEAPPKSLKPASSKSLQPVSSYNIDASLSDVDPKDQNLSSQADWSTHQSKMTNLAEID